MTLSIKDPGSALTHFIGMILAGLAATPLLVLAAKDGGRYAVPALAIFAASMILLYGASTTYHTFNISEKVNKVLRKIDHMMIFILIAGSYTPICVIPLRDTVGIPLLILVWAVAIAGMLIKAFWITCPKWFSSTIYIAMGWLCVLAMVPLVQTLPTAAFISIQIHKLRLRQCKLPLPQLFYRHYFSAEHYPLYFYRYSIFQSVQC